MEICCSCRCSDARPKFCRTVQGSKAPPLFSAALETGLTGALCQCNYTNGDVLFIQVCSDATPKHCRTCQGSIAFPVFSVALQTSVTATLCQCNYTYGDSLFMQVCSDATPKHCRTCQGKIAPPTVQCCSGNWPHSKLVPLQLHLWRAAVHAGVQ